ncbi:MAG: hypothetical protein A2493_03665 [Candidatus Magasanikbacteria bacterium RIFOXYC12_FULL_33_11]|uniref:VWFA domain-containing protein n=1 Tax=Candidatus Magasanikbacteria bacterium RIFOXYC12_FULL_33_11 TaxID=1798701 RepID=A0A1F6NR80_9BACT|nr:MAG: hypothetical protein A2493_03665 [Candidatus Magasanikbacteria bacterium RIFOXYC12_FULL_33_11]
MDEYSRRGIPEQVSQKKGEDVKLTREMLFLAEQSAEGKLKVLPGKSWSLHYPVDPEVRAEKLQGLLDGRYSAKEVAKDITPNALFYDIEDIKNNGLESVGARVRDLSAFIANYDYPRFAQFVESMRGRDIDISELDRLYTEIAQTRVQKKVMDAYGYTGRKQMEKSLRQEAEEVISGQYNYSRSQKVLKALKTNWLNESLGLMSSEEKDGFISTLSGDERKIFEMMKDNYRDYIHNGSESSYLELIRSIRDNFENIKKPIDTSESSESMQKLEQELEEYKENVVPPGAPEDPAIPPEDNDEYHTPPPTASGESKEKMQERAIFNIEPPLGGYYISGRKSYFDVDSKTWSKKKQLVDYSTEIKGKDRHTISGMVDVGLKSLPIPSGYALDVTSLKTQGANISFKRDQNGCFYLNVKSGGSFSVDFLKEKSPFVDKVISEDTAPLYKGKLSQKTESAISKLIGSNLQKAEQVRQHMLANHFYPGGGDLDSAQALQYKLRFESTGDNYLQNIDVSEYLECYSANTKFVAMMRQAKVPARLVVGHKVEGSKDGKSAVTQNTGHAWSEIWDGKSWRRFDATPQPKPEDKKPENKNEEDSKKDFAPEAEDGGVENSQSQQNQESQDGQEGQEGGQKSSDQEGQKDQSGESSKSQQNQESQEGQKGQEGGQENSDQKGQKKDSSQDSQSGQQQSDNQNQEGSSNPLDQMEEASDAEMQESEQQMDEVKEKLEEMEKQKQEMAEKINQSESFKDLSEMQKEIEKSELFDDLKQELEEKLEAKEEQMKDKMKDDLDKMVDDGFLDEKKRDEIIKEMEQRKLEELDQVQRQIEYESRLYDEYDNIREEILPLVDRWFEYFAERLPKKDDVSIDEDSLSRRGSFDRRSIMKARNLIFGTIKNPREIRSSLEPKFLASILVDVSGSMAGENLFNARKLLIFYSELFSKISEVFGYINFSVHLFSDSIVEVKGFKQDYDSPERYAFSDGKNSTVKVRLMEQLKVRGGTNMLDAIRTVARELNEEVENYPDYASALYFVGDGADTCGNSTNIKRFLGINEAEYGFGEHMYSAILLGDERQRRELSDIFGDDHTTVAPNFETLIEQSMDKFEQDLEEYLRDKT